MCDEKTNMSEPLLIASIDGTMASKPGRRIVPGTKARQQDVPVARGLPACCPGGARCRGGVSSSLALGWNRRTSRLDTVMVVQMGQEPPGRQEGGPQAANAVSGRVPTRGTGTGRPVVVMKAL